MMASDMKKMFFYIGIVSDLEFLWSQIMNISFQNMRNSVKIYRKAQNIPVTPFNPHNHLNIKTDSNWFFSLLLRPSILDSCIIIALSLRCKGAAQICYGTIYWSLKFEEHVISNNQLRNVWYTSSMVILH